MNKEAFLAELGSRLAGLPEEDLEERISFYREMIDDRVTDGQTEEEAVAGVGSVDDIVAQITAEIPLGKLIEKKVRAGRTLKGWEIALLVLGAPLWIPLLIAALAVLLAVFAVLGAAVFSLWAVDLSLAAAALASFAGAVPFLSSGNPAGAGAAFGAGLILAGVAILMFYVCLWLSRGMIRVLRKTLLGIKSLFMKEA